ncbi:subtilisin family serine protease [Isoptericola jiangsuensis]|uniref:Subtilisin family serine protease n=1 Tax=Isoptericola jiangsuensis TaxID=548579 RepID=A0A2A9ETY0_9MICO|nr:S8 family serine peptidase [Isoptericola jiangsuensis]PFG41722.1 subtilisin family serine protease [Isoptericola jiangsuensis]
MRRKHVRVAGIALALALATPVVTASAQPVEPAAPDSTETVTTSTVTLLTGDRVTVRTDAAGETTYVVEPADGTGRQVVFLQSEVDGDTYLVPSDVAPLTGAFLDRELFNITELVADGFTDEATDSLPLIVQRDTTARAARGLALPLDDTLALPAVDGVAGDLAKDDTTELGALLAAKAAGDTASARGLSPLAGIEKIWLDGRVEVSALDTNLTQIGAPTAWAEGLTGEGVDVAVLDTGIDLTHPDIAGQVTASADFTDSGSVTDVHGHGTHVAATIAGTGAGAPGLRTGVAPDADLLIGRVLGSDGYGSDSGVIAGMTWAVDQGADVVNMSLGGGASDGSDPVSVALDELAAESGTLFVVAAGNSGPGISTVTAPAVADRALAVAAVDSAGTVAAFSSRGPRIGGGIKPEIAAPGVFITAARAAGTGNGADPLYSTMSGTSMASPHVAGAAAIVAQAHPDWTGEQIKHALTASATPKGSVNHLGAGVVDVPAATDQTLLPSESALALGRVGSEDVQFERTLTVTNTGSETVVADVDGWLSTMAHRDGPDGLYEVSPSVVEIAPGGEAELTVSVDSTGVPIGMYEGYVALTPRDAGVPDMRVPMTLDRAEIVTAMVLSTDGYPMVHAQVGLINLDTGERTVVTTGTDGTGSVRANPGRFAAVATVPVPKADGSAAVAVLTADEIDESGIVVLDARDTREYSVTLEGKETRPEFLVAGLARKAANGQTVSTGLLGGGAYGQFSADDLLVSPTAGLAADSVVFSEHWRLADADSDNRAGDTTTMYDLGYVHDEVADEPMVLTTEDQAALARVEHRWDGPGVATKVQELTFPRIPGAVGIDSSSPSFVPLPADRVDYMTPDVLWQRQLYQRIGKVEMNVDRTFTQYAPGEQTSEAWNGGPFTSNAIVETLGSEMRLRLNDMVDDGGHLGRYADWNWPSQVKASLAVTRDGQKLTTKTLAYDTYSVVLPDAEPATFEVRRTYDAGSTFPAGGQVDTTWTFTGQGGTTVPTLSSVLNLRYDTNTDRLGHGDAGRSLRVGVEVLGAEGEATVTAAAWTTDGGATWTKVNPKSVTASGQMVIGEEHLEAGDVVGFRLAATDATGTAVDQTLLRAVTMD